MVDAMLSWPVGKCEAEFAAGLRHAHEVDQRAQRAHAALTAAALDSAGDPAGRAAFMDRQRQELMRACEEQVSL